MNIHCFYSKLINKLYSKLDQWICWGEFNELRFTNTTENRQIKEIEHAIEYLESIYGVCCFFSFLSFFTAFFHLSKNLYSCFCWILSCLTVIYFYFFRKLNWNSCYQVIFNNDIERTEWKQDDLKKQFLTRCTTFTYDNSETSDTLQLVIS